MATKKHCSPAQKQLLLEFIEQNSALAKQRISNQYTCSEMRSKWIEISAVLNATPGVQKEWKEWRKCWSDIKTRIKKRQADINRSAQKTGGGPSEQPPLDTLELKILNLIGGQEMIEGQHTVPEPGLPISVSPPEYVEDISCTDPKENENFDVARSFSSVEEENSIENNRICTKKSEQVSHAFQDISGKQNKRVKPPAGRGIRTIPVKGSVQVATNMVNISSRKCDIKENYYKEKIEIMKKKLDVDRRIAEALESIADSISQSDRRY